MVTYKGSPNNDFGKIVSMGGDQTYFGGFKKFGENSPNFFVINYIF